MTAVGHALILRAIPFLLIPPAFCPFVHGEGIRVDDDGAGANTSKHNRPQKDTGDTYSTQVIQG